ncbi:MAG: hypothetical protein FWB75_05900 [Oscillospiraceae bacterium]|nr:hypothetical protein [Oscillospiraceae bacterium]
MNGLDNVIEYIRENTSEVCAQVAQKTSERCEKVKADYSRREQDEYWKIINHGTKSAEMRVESLSKLASTEANKQISSMQAQMLSQAFAIAEMKLNELPADEYALVLEKHNMPPDLSSHDFLELKRESLNKEVLSVLFG